ncbi:MAG: hypothetical protein Q9186_005448 [Xanthomendoza sp. 1 TL-2023]
MTFASPTRQPEAAWRQLALTRDSSRLHLPQASLDSLPRTQGQLRLSPTQLRIMTHFKAAHFEVVTANKSSPMYDDPDASNDDDPFTQQKYIEAITGATFQIKVTLDRAFDFADCDAVRVMVHLDGDSRGCDSRVSLEQIKSLGSIRITYQRIYHGKIQQALTGARYSTYEPVSEVSEKILKGKSIQCSIIPTTFVESLPPQPTVQAIPLRGTLQMLGCIPRSPSPEPILGSRNGRATTAANTNVKEELRTLRARLAELENRASTTPQPNIKPEQRRSGSSVKREREDAENTVERKRNRKSGPVETVDLTSD